jgi:YidC/Oxa1 family membrane protein insertase
MIRMGNLEKLSMEVRMLIALALAGVVMGISMYFTPPPPPPTAEDQNKTAKAEQAAPAPAGLPTPTAATEAAAQTGAIQAAAAETVVIETDVHKVTFSNRGGTVRSWILKAYKDTEGKPLELVNQRALKLTGKQALPDPFALSFKNKASSDPNQALFRVTRNGLGVTFDYADGRLTVKKSFDFAKDSYLVKVSTQAVENGVLLPHSLVWRGGFGDEARVNPTADARSLYFDASGSSLEKKQASDADDAPISTSGNYAFAGLEDTYFAGVALPGDASSKSGASLELTTYSDTLKNAADKDEAHVGAAIGGSGANTFQFYAGPKDVDLLAKVDARLPQLLDWGWFWFIAQPIFYALKWIVATITHNYGWAIILLTIAINTLTFPLRLSSMKSAKKMQQMQPQLKALNEKYAGAPMNDPRKSEEMMELYRKNGVNPAGGCLPMLLQIPVFYALYKALSIAIELRGAEWLWVADLSQPETLAIRLLPVLLVVTQFFQQKMTPSPGMDSAQQNIMLMMPLLMGYMFYWASSGLVLYWLTSNVVSIAQQWLLNRNTSAPAVAVVVPPIKKK